jgi:signal transduction histidine kinase
MWPNISLKARIYLLLALLVSITLVNAPIGIWYSFRMEKLIAGMVRKDVSAMQAAEDLVNALVNQKGFVSYYFLDGDPDWLQQLAAYRQVFEGSLAHARRIASGPLESGLVDRIEAEYRRYVEGKDRVIDLNKRGEYESGRILHREVRGHFFAILGLCENHKKLHRERIEVALAEAHTQAQHLRAIALAALVGAFALGLGLTMILVRQIIGPLKRLMEEAGLAAENPQQRNLIVALQRSVLGLKEEFAQAHSELERSREHLQQTEKLALVGKLAAGMAHSIRNPFTSVKMRLFSLSRSLKLNPVQEEDFQVISDEIRHIDTIVQNFLEFSRPPKLKMQPVSPSTVVDQVIQLLEHRLKSYEVSVEVLRLHPLPAIRADAEQLKEVLVNLIINACEAMEREGAIRIQEEEATVQPLGRVAVIRVSDNGPGIDPALRPKVFQPFFTTKEDGTGLGLSIATRIVEEHGGWLDVDSEAGTGATFVITLPVK